MSIPFIFFTILMSSVVLFAQVFVVYVVSEIYNKRDIIIKRVLYLTLIKYIGIYLILYTFFWLFSNFFYKVIYLIGFTYIGYLLNVLMFCCLYKLISKFKKIPPFYSKILVFIIPLIITIYSLVNAQITEFQEETLVFPGYNNSIKIMHFSDVHLGVIYQKGTVEDMVEIINEKNPDVVVITGDFADGSKNVDPEWIKPLDNVKDNIPILYVTGNHESLYGKDDILNEIYKVKKINHIGDNGKVINIKGVSFIGLDFEYKDPKIKAKTIIDKYGIDINSTPVVLLYHIPKVSLEDLNEIGVFLMLAGHTHKGQIFPMNIFSWIGNKYFGGLYSNNNKNYVFVSCGFGTALVPMRMFSSKLVGIINIRGN